MQCEGACYGENVSAGTLISLDEYLRTSYSPDREYRDGVLVERNVGSKSHAWLQKKLIQYLANRERAWGLFAFPELRIRVRERWYPIPDVCIYAHEFDEAYPTVPPLLWIEILSDSDSMVDVWNKAKELVASGVPYVWIIDPNSLESELRTPNGSERIEGKTLRIPESPIVIPLRDVVEE